MVDRETFEQHQRDMDTLRLNSSSRPSLLSLARYYREQSENQDCTPADRRLWAALADEMDKAVSRAGDGPMDGQIELF